MIALTDIGFEFGGRFLYRNANWHIKPNERIGLIGMNGTGKSTLLRVINGEYQLTEGNISKPRDLTIGFLNQDQLSFETEASILQVAMSAFQRQLDLEIEIEKVLKIMETDYSDEVLNKLSNLQTEFDALDGYSIHHKCEKVLEGLGFTTAQLQQPYKKFSGGWRMRVMLAKLLLQSPKLLMLDEPTNHLDLPTIEWLENYLKDYNGTVIVVSHDREFLDKMVTKIVEVSMQKIFEYSGNYSYYLESKSERMDLQQRQFDNQQQFIKQQENFINRFKAKASKATAAQSRVKLLEKLDRIEVPEDDNAEINIDFRVSVQSGKVVAEIQDASKSFPDIEILRNATGEIVRGDKIALIGANGKGKSTLLRMIAGAEPFEGEIVRGHNIIEAFYAQHQLESLNLENEIIDELRQHGSGKSETELRTILGCFLFTNDEVFKKIKVLSGGEKARVALARTLLLEANFMLLDEPTNHLDMRSINILTQALQNYEGTFVVVSHDRYFVSQIANKIWWIEDGEIKEYLGSYDEYEYWRKKQEDIKKLQDANDKKASVGAPKVKKEKQADKNTIKPNSNQLQQLQKDFAGVEKVMGDLKTKITATEQHFLDTNLMQNTQKAQEINAGYELLKNELTILEAQYEKLFEQIMELEQNS
ncbi:MAG: ABC-F family ATP-binding cassette domain-containing protein [Bacteroidia bacterium]|nr:ABC-F family ATP-binding cassette domain-containing protein [Bacteroidia bacterium]MBP9689157.1 ABC-F family ATP-binding cassette domain-containing protein [Bacteroidia bacterium]